MGYSRKVLDRGRVGTVTEHFKDMAARVDAEQEKMLEEARRNRLTSSTKEVSTMSNSIIRNEQAISLFGYEARAFNVVADNTGRIITQRIGLSKSKGKERLSVELRFDDNCNNGHESFAITATLYEGKREVAGGCLHEEIVKYFPKLEPLIKWHLTSTDGPMHYIANTLYLAGDRDYNGKVKGEPSHWATVIKFNDNPMAHKFKPSFIEFLQGNDGRYDYEVIGINHTSQDSTGYQFKPKFTFGGYADRWHECPFDDEQEALDFLYALQNCSPRFERIVTGWGEGKVRELDAARRSAVWPEATDEQLSLPKDQLRELLAARLPALLAEFKVAMLNCGFLWPATSTNGD